MLGGLALALAFAVVCVFLGRWQWGRYEERSVQAQAVTTHYAAAPVPLGSATARIPPSEEDQWLRVTARGRYATGEELLVRNRALDGQPGLEVLVPLDLSGDLTGTRVFVDRGWVANADSAADLPQVPPTPTGEVTVEGWLRSGEPDLGKERPAGQLASIDLGAADRRGPGARRLPRARFGTAGRPTAGAARGAGHRPGPAPGLRDPVVAHVRVRARPARVPPACRRRGPSRGHHDGPETQEGTHLGRRRRLRHPTRFSASLRYLAGTPKLTRREARAG